MARKTPSRLDKRREIEAAEAMEATTGKKKAKKKATKKKAATRKRAKEKVPERRQLIWAIFSGNMKEEARFPYDQRAEADEKVEKLRAKSKKLYFVQPIKEAVPDAPADDKS